MARIFRTESKGDEKPYVSSSHSSECMSIRTYTFYTLHVSNAYFPKIYVMWNMHSFAITESQAIPTFVFGPIFSPFFHSYLLIARFTRFYDFLTKQINHRSFSARIQWIYDYIYTTSLIGFNNIRSYETDQSQSIPPRNSYDWPIS